ncbi:DNA repair protein RecO [Parvicella tangerina]|uniref:DNA repair protein RecO n=1 Tax=Parvicella tangerina TaxID=2829795 RepID=A0A916NJA4_9FLAO|nr:DNA repair protein RecO [Parvicella tangerina]CAG5085753.1 DNA repair protein RecO [Parvicella tangerina]
MRQTIHGIYLGHLNYSETSVIARFYTQEYGKRSFLLKGVKGKKSKTAGLLQALNELQVTCNFRPERELNTAFTIESNHTLHQVHNDFRKSTIAVFLAEILNKSIIEEEPNRPLYLFLTHRLTELNHETFDANFHLKFLLELSLFLGFYPRLSVHASDQVFNLEEGLFEHEQFHSPLSLDKETSQLLKSLIQDGKLPKVTNEDRARLLDGLVSYYEVQLHLKPNSFQAHQVLKTVFS